MIKREYANESFDFEPEKLVCLCLFSLATPRCQLLSLSSQQFKQFLPVISLWIGLRAVQNAGGAPHGGR